MKQRVLKAKDDCSSWSSGKHCKIFSKINDSVKSSLRKWTISHPHVIKSCIENDYIVVKFDDGIRGSNTELRQKVLLQVSVHEVHMDIKKNTLLGFPLHTTKNEWSVLVILILDWFSQQNYKRWLSAIKPCVVEKYASRLEHMKSSFIIGVSGNWDI